MTPISKAASQVAGAATVLVLRSQAAAGDDAEIRRQLIGERHDLNLLGFSFSQPPSVWYDTWCAALDTEPTAAAVITTPELVSGEHEDIGLDVETVVNPSNLTGMGVKSTPYLSKWTDATVCVESLSILLQYADQQSVYRFLHVLTMRLRSTDATGIVYFDPTTADERTVQLITSLFDAVLEHDPETGAWNARVRDA